MSFRFYTNAVGRASRTVAGAMFVFGLALVGFGFMIYLLPKLFATVAAIVFFVAGAGCAITGARIFLAQRKLDRMDSSESSGYRKNVRIHCDEYRDW
ncbi:MAG: hypothetical protein JSU94_22130 [Phycisphaerales bacterium]|nr:MAG: hypothetical protein JSU94_22130 [Phycisphaerales bacterium]